MVDDNQIYVVVDIEADGPTPGLYSMLSIGAVATTAQKEVSQFYRTILPIEGAQADPDTIEWWKSQPEAWQEVTTDARHAKEVMQEFCTWLDSLGKEPVFVAHPIALDYTFVSWYLYKFMNRNPFSNEKHISRTLDMRSFVAGKFEVTITQAHRSKLPENLTKGMPEHTHNALEDAVGYGAILRNVLNAKSTDYENKH